MTTLFSSTVQPTNSTDALFRDWASFIHDLFITTGGWTNTADTGQINLSTVTAPGAGDTKQGYKIYEMDDTLQATAPIFVRIDFGSGVSTNQPGIWITIGTGSNGSGTITNIFYNGGAVANANVQGTSNSATAQNNYGSAAPNRIVCMMGVGTTVGRTLMFGIERTKDSTGIDTGTGVMVFLWGYGLGTITSSVFTRSSLVYSGVANPNEEVGWSFVMSALNPSAFSSDVGIGIPLPMRGYARPPGYNLALVANSDFSAEASFAVNIYGNNITFQSHNVGNLVAPTIPGTSGATIAAVRLCIRYD